MTFNICEHQEVASATDEGGCLKWENLKFIRDFFYNHPHFLWHSHKSLSCSVFPVAIISVIILLASQLIDFGDILESVLFLTHLCHHIQNQEQEPVELPPHQNSVFPVSSSYGLSAVTMIFLAYTFHHIRLFTCIIGIIFKSDKQKTKSKCNESQKLPK